MNGEMIEIFGITPSNKFPKCPQDYPCTEFCETDKLCVPCKKPDIREILQVFVTVSICSFKTICTPMGKKLVINGLKHVKILYIANNNCNDVHCAHFDVPFCTFILLKKQHVKVIDINTAIEHIFVKQSDCRCFSVSTIIFICPIFKKKNDCSCDDDCNEDCSDDYYDNCNHNHKNKSCNISITCGDNIIFGEPCDNFTSHKSYKNINKNAKNIFSNNKLHFSDTRNPYYYESNYRDEENYYNNNCCDYAYYEDNCCNEDDCERCDDNDCCDTNYCSEDDCNNTCCNEDNCDDDCCDYHCNDDCCNDNKNYHEH